MRFLQMLIAVLALALAPFATAAEFQEGVHFTVVNPQPVDTPKGKIEVTEFFWYGCPHCYSFEPALNKWRKSLPADVVFRRVPAVFNPRWAQGAKVYYTLEALGLTDKLHGEMFDVYQAGKITGEKDLADWLSAKGVERQKVVDTYNSFSVQNRVARAQQIVPGYGITGVPALAVGGRYVTSPSQVQSEEKALAVMDFLIAKARAEQAKK